MSRHVVYNITVQIEKSVEKAWIQEVTQEIMPAVLDGEIVLSIQLNRIENPVKGEDVNYALQFLFPSLEVYNTKRLERLSILIKMMDGNFSGKYVYFGTMMEVLHYCSK